MKRPFYKVVKGFLENFADFHGSVKENQIKDHRHKVKGLST